MGCKSAFYDPRRAKHRYQGLLLVPPPTMHMAAYVTGGLQTLYNNIHQKHTDKNHAKLGSYTDHFGYFAPQIGMPLLADRYKYVATIGKGQSSVIIKASDTFQKDFLVAVKVLRTTYFLIGSQEAEIMLEFSRNDSLVGIPVVQLQNVFCFEDHYCLTFELLLPDPITSYFKSPCQGPQLICLIREVAIQMLNVLSFLRQKNVIHADLKPDNILLSAGTKLNSMKVVDFGNAIRCIQEELSLYYTDYDLQALIYRAPEVLLGVGVGLQVDMWSLGCILVELYLGRPLFWGRNREEVLEKITSLLGPVPEEFKQGKFYPQFHHCCLMPKEKLNAIDQLHKVFGHCQDWLFLDFLSKMLSLKPEERLDPDSALLHEFVASPSHVSLMSGNTDKEALPETYHFQKSEAIISSIEYDCISREPSIFLDGLDNCGIELSSVSKICTKSEHGACNVSGRLCSRETIRLGSFGRGKRRSKNTDRKSNERNLFDFFYSDLFLFVCEAVALHFDDILTEVTPHSSSNPFFQLDFRDTGLYWRKCLSFSRPAKETKIISLYQKNCGHRNYLLFKSKVKTHPLNLPVIKKLMSAFGKFKIDTSVISFMRSFKNVRTTYLCLNRRTFGTKLVATVLVKKSSKSLVILILTKKAKRGKYFLIS